MFRLFRFEDFSMDKSDKIDSKGKVQRHFEVNVIEKSVDAAVIKARLDEYYKVTGVFNLGPGWNS